MNLHAPKGIDVENWFIECYRKYKGHPMWILLGLYGGCIFLYQALTGVGADDYYGKYQQRYYERRTGRIPAYFY